MSDLKNSIITVNLYDLVERLPENNELRIRVEELIFSHDSGISTLGDRVTDLFVKYLSL
jgi:hypothetical protein